MSIQAVIPALQDGSLYQTLRTILAKALDCTRLPLFADEANQRVGVGTLAPTSKLSVAGGDIATLDAGKGVVLKTPDGTKTYRLFIDNAGQLSVLRLTTAILLLACGGAVAQDAVGSTKTYTALGSTQTHSAQINFTTIYSSGIGGTPDSNGVNFSSAVYLSQGVTVLGNVVTQQNVGTGQAGDVSSSNGNFTTLYSSSIGGRPGNNGITISSNAAVSGDLVVTGNITLSGSIFPSTATPSSYNLAFASSASNQNTGAADYVGVTGSTVTITVGAGRRVRLQYQGVPDSGSGAGYYVRFRMMSGPLEAHLFSNTVDGANNPANLYGLYISSALAAGTYPFSLQFHCGGADCNTVHSVIGAQPWHFTVEEIR